MPLLEPFVLLIKVSLVDYVLLYLVSCTFVCHFFVLLPVSEIGIDHYIVIIISYVFHITYTILCQLG